MSTTTIEGQLEIDHERGVIYFHSHHSGWSVLRISKMPAPIPEDINFIDISMFAVAGETRISYLTNSERYKEVEDANPS